MSRPYPRVKATVSVVNAIDSFYNESTGKFYRLHESYSQGGFGDTR